MYTARVVPLVFTVLLLGAAACARDPEIAKRQHTANGDAFMAAKKYAEASIEYRQALKLDNRFAAGYYKLGEAYAAAGDVRNALSSYTRAADLDPENVDANLKAGNLLLLARRFQDARTRARAILTKDQKNLAGLVLMGNALAGLQNLEDAVAVAERAAELAPERAGVQGNLGVFELARGNTVDAEKAFLRATEAAPKSTSPLIALANLYQTLGRFSEAEKVLHRALALDPRHLQANGTLATLYMHTGRAPEAEQHMKVVAEVAGTSESRLGLADYYIGLGRVRDALAILQQVSETPDGYAPSQVRKAMIDHASGRRDEAHKLLRDVMAREPKNVAALAMEARFLLAESRVKEAETLVMEAIAADPRSAQVWVTLGKIHQAKNATEEARRAFTEAANLDPTRADAQIELALIHLRRREVDTSIRYAERGVRSEPESLDARLALVRTLTARPDDAKRADEQLKLLLTRYPGSADVRSITGLAALARNDRSSARLWFQRALEVDPNHVEALGGLTTLDAEANRLGDARARLEGRIAATPRPSAGLLLLAAKVYVASGLPDQTERALRRLIELEPSNLEAYNLLGQFYVSQRKLSEAKREFTQLAAREPRSVTTHTMLGLLSQAEGDMASARKAYEAAVQIEPRAAAAANNLAWIYANEGEKLDVALQLAQTARAYMPESAEIADTLGFVYMKKDMAGFAVPLLTQCTEREPNNPIFHYHLGLAYAQDGEDAKARRALERALKLNPKFDGAEDARRVLSRLVF